MPAQPSWKALSWLLGPRKPVRPIHNIYLLPAHQAFFSLHRNSKLDDFLPTVEKSSANGDFYWSLFGRDQNCCDFITHVCRPPLLPR